MKIKEIVSFLETLAPPSLQESYDNAGLITGQADWDCTGIICSLDAIESVVEEAITKKCNLIVAHHPIIFGGLKKINGKNYVERTIIAAIKHDIAIYAIHTNLDNVKDGVNGRIADLLGLQHRTILLPKKNTLHKLYTFVPPAHAEQVRSAIFQAGAGHIGDYSECGFSQPGTGTFKAGLAAQPFVGTRGERHEEAELRIETVFPAWLERKIIAALKAAHPYEEVAYDVVPLGNSHPDTGSGMVGDLPAPMDETQFLGWLKNVFGLTVVKHTRLLHRPIQRVAVCGGAGSFLVSNALAVGADAFVTADLKYHEFFDADDRMLMADIGHYESEQFTISLLHEVLTEKFPNFAVLKTVVETNPVRYS